LATETLERAADNALSVLTPTPAPTGESAVILDSSVAALVAHQCVGRAFEADRWLSGESLIPRLDGPLGSPKVSIVDDPSVGGAYGSYFFDDEGYPAAATHLVRAGEIAMPVTDRATAAALDVPRTANARRATPLDPMSPRVSNVSFEPGSMTRDELIENMDSGLLLEGGLVARMDLRSGRFAVRATRARDIEKGKLSGRLYGTVDLHGDLRQLLTNVAGVSSETERYASTCVHGERNAVPISISGPMVLTRGEVSG
jgi:TldD protein